MMQYFLHWEDTMLRKQSRMLTLCLTGMLLFSAELTISAQNASAEKKQKAAAPKVLSPEEQLKEKLRKGEQL